MSKIDLLRWVAPGLMLALLVILVRRRQYKRFPVFFAYCLSIVGVTVMRFLARLHPMAFFLVYWSTEACYLVIAFLVMLSILRPLTQLEYVRYPWSRFLLIPFLALTLGIAFWVAFSRPINRTPAGRFASAVYVFVVLMCLAELVLFLESFRARGRYPIKWTRYEFGILSGFGLMSLFNLVAYLALVLRLLGFNVGPQVETFFHAFPIGAFVGSAIVWLIVFSKPEPPRPAPPPDLIGRLEDAARVLEEQIEFVKTIAKHLGLRSAALNEPIR